MYFLIFCHHTNDFFCPPYRGFWAVLGQKLKKRIIRLNKQFLKKVNGMEFFVLFFNNLSEYDRKNEG